MKILLLIFILASLLATSIAHEYSEDRGKKGGKKSGKGGGLGKKGGKKCGKKGGKKVGKKAGKKGGKKGCISDPKSKSSRRFRKGHGSQDSEDICFNKFKSDFVIAYDGPKSFFNEDNKDAITFLQNAIRDTYNEEIKPSTGLEITNVLLRSQTLARTESSEDCGCSSSSSSSSSDESKDSNESSEGDSDDESNGDDDNASEADDDSSSDDDYTNDDDSSSDDDYTNDDDDSSTDDDYSNDDDDSSTDDDDSPDDDYTKGDDDSSLDNDNTSGDDDDDDDDDDHKTASVNIQSNDEKMRRKLQLGKTYSLVNLYTATGRCRSCSKNTKLLKNDAVKRRLYGKYRELQSSQRVAIDEFNKRLAVILRTSRFSTFKDVKRVFIANQESDLAGTAQ